MTFWTGRGCGSAPSRYAPAAMSAQAKLVCMFTVTIYVVTADDACTSS